MPTLRLKKTRCKLVEGGGLLVHPLVKIGLGHEVGWWKGGGNESWSTTIGDLLEGQSKGG